MGLGGERQDNCRSFYIGIEKTSTYIVVIVLKERKEPPNEKGTPSK